MSDETLTIGELAQRVGLATSAIRFYERTGVLPEPARVSGRRRYGPDAVRRLEVLNVAKRAGFSLDEAKVLLMSADAGTPAFEAIRDLAERKLPEIEALIARAQDMRAWMLTATDCSCTTLDVCGLFDAGEEGEVNGVAGARASGPPMAGEAPVHRGSPDDQRAV